MPRFTWFSGACFVGFLAVSSAHALPRDAQQKAAFRKSNACPSTGKHTGACPGYEVDHKKALMNGGADTPQNMQWLSKNEHKTKTAKDVAECKNNYGCKNKKLKKKLPWADKKAKKRAKAV